MFKFEEQSIKGVYVITPQVFGDSRGYFAETFKAPDFEAVGIPTVFVQDNESCSSKGVLRGLHFQKEHTQGKLVRVTSGCVYDVAVDVRPGSETFGKYVGVTLDSEKKQMFSLPLSPISAQMCTTRHPKAESPGMIRTWPWNGRSWIVNIRPVRKTASILDLKSKASIGQKGGCDERYSISWRFRYAPISAY